MARTPRYRERKSSTGWALQQKVYYKWAPILNSGVANKSYETCTDTTGPTDEDGPLDLHKLAGDPPTFNTVDEYPEHGIGGPVYYWTKMSDWIPPHFRDQDPRGLGLPSPDWNDLALRARANINPNRATVDLPLFLFELRDIPRGIKQAGDLLNGGFNLNSIAGNNLAVQFGWRPLLDDLLDLLDIQEAIARRLAYLTALAKGEPFHIKRRLGSESYVGAPTTTIYYYNYGSVGIRGYTQIKGSERYWFSTKVSSTFEPTLDYNLRRAAIRSTLGLNVSLSTIWNMIPWTWLIDWFSNLGLILAAYRGGVPFTVDHFNIMASATAEYRFHPVSMHHRITFQNPSRTWTRKLRKVVVPNPIPAFNLPILTGRQIGILGSLWATRGRTPLH